ncbi:MAG: arginase family protein [Actinomycetota bacterium]|nr:arginase family protein [Actinomycetota bacterium]
MRRVGSNSGRSIVVVDAPSNLGLRPPRAGKKPGVRKLATALRSRGIVSCLDALDGGCVTPPPYSPDVDPETTIISGETVGEFSVDLAGKVDAVLGDGHFPLVLGGDCSILIGSMLALRSLGRFGLVFIDGHLDFRHPGNSEVVGAAAGAELALVSGRGPERLTNLGGSKPLVRDEDIFALGKREDDPETRDARDTGIEIWDLSAVREIGPGEAAARAVETLRANGVDGFWIHLDADVLDDEVMPAVDSRQPGGLSYAELIQVLRVLLRADPAVGMQVTIFDPELDPTGEIAKRFTSAVVAGFMGEEHGV